MPKDALLNKKWLGGRADSTGKNDKTWDCIGQIGGLCNLESLPEPTDARIAPPMPAYVHRHFIASLTLSTGKT